MAVIITYDVSDKQEQVKASMVVKGYSQQLPVGGKAYNLPFTTLFHSGKTQTQALEDMELVCSTHKVELTHCLALRIWRDSFSAITGEPYET